MKNSFTIPATTRPEKTRQIEIASGGKDIAFSADLKALLERSGTPKTTTPTTDTSASAAGSPKPYNLD